MDPHAAAVEILANLPEEITVERDLDGRSSHHAAWMLQGIAFGYIQHDKAQRWLGYAQGILVANGVVTLTAMKRVNKGLGVAGQR